jgi:hypothetical protein
VQAPSKWLTVGRLDFNTEGSLIFTTSGESCQPAGPSVHGLERKEYARACSANSIRRPPEAADEQSISPTARARFVGRFRRR